jgi:hypothetical protein
VDLASTLVPVSPPSSPSPQLTTAILCTSPLKAPSVAGFACVEQLRNIDIIQRGYNLLAAATDKDMRAIMGTIRGMLELR